LHSSLTDLVIIQTDIQSGCTTANKSIFHAGITLDPSNLTLTKISTTKERLNINHQSNINH